MELDSTKFNQTQMKKFMSILEKVFLTTIYLITAYYSMVTIFNMTSSATTWFMAMLVVLLDILWISVVAIGGVLTLSIIISKSEK